MHRHTYLLALAFQCQLGFSGQNVLVHAAGANQTQPDDALADFGQQIPVLGQMQRTDQDFKDGLALDLFSPTARSLVVQKNQTPLPGNFVSGSTGEPFIALSPYSYVIRMNETTKDLIAKIEVPYDPEKVRAQGVDVANLHVGTLAQNKKSWVVSEIQRNIHVTENKTRIIKMTSLDGEYMLLGRKTEDTANIFVQYGQGATRTVNITGGPGIQQAEFVDGLRFSIEAKSKMALNVDIPFGVPPSALPNGMQSLNSFAWRVNTSLSTGTVNATLNFPVNVEMLKALNTYDVHQIVVASRASNSSSFAPLAANLQKVVINPTTSIKVSGLTKLDGDYVLLLKEKGGVQTKNGTRNGSGKSSGWHVSSQDHGQRHI